MLSILIWCHERRTEGDVFCNWKLVLHSLSVRHRLLSKRCCLEVFRPWQRSRVAEVKCLWNRLHGLDFSDNWFITLGVLGGHALPYWASQQSSNPKSVAWLWSVDLATAQYVSSSHNGTAVLLPLACFIFCSMANWRFFRARTAEWLRKSLGRGCSTVVRSKVYQFKNWKVEGS